MGFEQCTKCGAESEDICSNCSKCSDCCQCGVSEEEFSDWDLDD